MILGQHRNKLKDGVKPLYMLIGSMESSERGVTVEVHLPFCETTLTTV